MCFALTGMHSAQFANFLVVLQACYKRAAKVLQACCKGAYKRAIVQINMHCKVSVNLKKHIDNVPRIWYPIHVKRNRAQRQNRRSRQWKLIFAVTIALWDFSHAGWTHVWARLAPPPLTHLLSSLPILQWMKFITLHAASDSCELNSKKRFLTAYFFYRNTQLCIVKFL